MIHIDEKTTIKTLLGHRYANVVKAYLIKNEVFNRNGKPFSSSQITNVMNGVSHPLIEEAIFDLIVLKRKEIEERKKLLNEINKISSENDELKKSVAVTTDS